jgi:hypothetical protein
MIIFLGLASLLGWSNLDTISCVDWPPRQRASSFQVVGWACDIPLRLHVLEKPSLFARLHADPETYHVLVTTISPKHKGPQTIYPSLLPLLSYFATYHLPFSLSPYRFLVSSPFLTHFSTLSLFFYLVTTAPFWHTGTYLHI